MHGHGSENDGAGDGFPEVFGPDDRGTAVGLDHQGNPAQCRPSLVDQPDGHAHGRVHVEPATPERRVVFHGRLHDVDETALVGGAGGPP